MKHHINQDTTRIQITITALLLCLATFVAYRGVAANGFIAFDDISYLLSNNHVYNGLSLEGIRWALTTRYEANWMPVSWLSHMIDMTLFGANPAGHHLMSLAIHCANVVLLLVLMLRLTGSLWCSAAVAALFALHPLNVESVAWVAERKNLLSTTFFLLTIMAYLRYVNRQSIAACSLVIILYSIGLMAKPMLVTLPLILLLLDWYPLRHTERNILWRIVEKLPLMALALASSTITIFSQYQDGAVKDRSFAAILQNIIHVPVNYCKYIAKAIAPTDLAVLYPYQPTIPWWQTAGALLLLLMITMAVILLRNSRPYLLTGWFWFLITLLPVVGFIRIGAHAVADRYAYLPLIGIFWASVVLAYDLYLHIPRWKTIVLVGGMALCILYAYMTTRQVRYWHDSITLFRHTLAATDNNWLIHNNISVELIKQGDITGSLHHVQQALRIKPDYADAYYNLGKVHANRKEYPQAIAAYRAAISLDPYYANAYTMLTILYTALGNTDDAQSINKLQERNMTSRHKRTRP